MANKAEYKRYVELILEHKSMVEEPCECLSVEGVRMTEGIAQEIFLRRVWLGSLRLREALRVEGQKRRRRGVERIDKTGQAEEETREAGLLTLGAREGMVD